MRPTAPFSLQEARLFEAVCRGDAEELQALLREEGARTDYRYEVEATVWRHPPSARACLYTRTCSTAKQPHWADVCRLMNSSSSAAQA